MKCRLLFIIIMVFSLIAQGCGDNNSINNELKNDDTDKIMAELDKKSFNSSAELDSKMLIHDDGNKAYYADTENMYLDKGGFYTLDVITTTSQDRTFLKKNIWQFNRDENIVFYRIFDSVGNKESNGQVVDNDLATIIYSFANNHLDYMKKVNVAPTLFKSSNTKQDNGKSTPSKKAPTPKTQSKEIYVGTYESGLKAYLLADTLKMDSLRDFSVKIKAVDDNGNIVYVDYDFSGSPGEPDTWRNSQGYSGKVDYDNPSVETNIHNYHSKKWSEYVLKNQPGNRR